MGKKKKHVFEGDINFTDMDPQVARFEKEAHPDLVGFRRLQMKAGLMPADFELDRYEVTGRYHYEIVVTER